MKLSQRAGSLLGLARNAGMVASGAVAVDDALKKHKAKGVIADATMSDDSLKQYMAAADKAGIPFIAVEGEPGRYIGYSERKILTVNDEKFFKVIQKEIINSNVGVNNSNE